MGGLLVAVAKATIRDVAAHTRRCEDVHAAIRIGVPERIARAQTGDVGRVGGAADT